MLLSVLAVLSAAALPTASGKNVFAHYMVANSFSYTPSDWKTDINNAAATKIQGFALNTAGNNYEPGQIANAYSAAAGTNFSFFFSFDCAAHSWDVSSMASLISTYAANPNTYKWNGAVLVSTYSGEANGDSFWASLKSTLSSQGIQISLAPAFIGYRAPGDASRLLSNFPSIDGFFNWWSWPQDNGNLLTTDTDLAYQSAIKSSRKGPFIMAVSPWQFKNLGSQNGNTNNDWVELSDTLWKYRWEQAIKNVVPDIVEIATWNDYAESHYISAINPSVSMDADAHAYVDGMVHTGWQIPAKHYISWYLNGGEPAVQTDQVILWYRLHPKDAVCSSGTRPRNAQYPADAIFGLALLTAPATVIMNIGSDQQFQWDAPAGASIGSVPFPSEDSQIPYIQIVRGGKVVADGYGSAYVTKSCATYNFNPFVDVIPH